MGAARKYDYPKMAKRLHYYADNAGKKDKNGKIMLPFFSHVCLREKWNFKYLSRVANEGIYPEFTEGYEYLQGAIQSYLVTELCTNPEVNTPAFIFFLKSVCGLSDKPTATNVITVTSGDDAITQALKGLVKEKAKNE